MTGSSTGKAMFTFNNKDIQMKLGEVVLVSLSCTLNILWILVLKLEICTANSSCLKLSGLNNFASLCKQLNLK